MSSIAVISTITDPANTTVLVNPLGRLSTAFHKFVAFWLPLTLTLALSQEGEGKEFSSRIPIGIRVGDEGTPKSFRYELVQFCT